MTLSFVYVTIKLSKKWKKAAKMYADKAEEFGIMKSDIEVIKIVIADHSKKLCVAA